MVFCNFVSGTVLLGTQLKFNLFLFQIVRGFWGGRGKRGIKVTGALRSAGFQKNPARPQIVFNRFTGLNMLV